MSFAQNPQYGAMSQKSARVVVVASQDALIGHRDEEQVTVGQPPETRGLTGNLELETLVGAAGRRVEKIAWR